MLKTGPQPSIWRRGFVWRTSTVEARLDTGPPANLTYQDFSASPQTLVRYFMYHPFSRSRGRMGGMGLRMGRIWQAGTVESDSENATIPLAGLSSTYSATNASPANSVTTSSHERVGSFSRRLRIMPSRPFGKLASLACSPASSTISSNCPRTIAICVARR